MGSPGVVLITAASETRHRVRQEVPLVAALRRDSPAGRSETQRGAFRVVVKSCVAGRKRVAASSTSATGLEDLFQRSSQSCLLGLRKVASSSSSSRVKFSSSGTFLARRRSLPIHPADPDLSSATRCSVAEGPARFAVAFFFCLFSIYDIFMTHLRHLFKTFNTVNQSHLFLTSDKTEKKNNLLTKPPQSF